MTQSKDQLGLSDNKVHKDPPALLLPSVQQEQPEHKESKAQLEEEVLMDLME